MAVQRFYAKLTNNNVDVTNYQIVGFSFDAVQTATDEEVAARILGYLGYLSSVNVIASGSHISEINWRPPASAGATPVPFPTAEYAALVTAAAAAGTTLPSFASGYATTLGGDALAPLGTSISVSERTQTVGPTGRGRHFLPYISRSTVNTQGTVATATLANITEYWGKLLNFFDPAYISSGGSTLPGVSSATGTVSNSIRFVKPQPVFSNLESRRR